MYMVFGSLHYEANGGFNDLIYMSEDQNEVLRLLDGNLDIKFDSFQVVNLSRDIIIEGDLLEVIEDLKDYHWDSLTDYLSTLTYYNK